MTYFEYLQKTGTDDGPAGYERYLVDACGYDEKYAKSMAALQFETRPKSVTEAEIWSPVNMGDAMLIS